MDEEQPIDGLVHELEGRRKRDKTRKMIYFLIALWIATLAALVAVAWNAYFQEKDRTLTLAEQVAIACEDGVLNPNSPEPKAGMGLSPAERKKLCNDAQRVVDNNSAKLDNKEIQDPEIQDPEIQDPEIQQPEIQNKETQDPESQDGETQDPEIQDPEIQDEETQDPEINDPDPNDQIEAGSCTFNGVGTIKFTFQTNTGPVTFECTGVPDPLPDPEPTP